MDELENLTITRLMSGADVPEAGDFHPEAVIELSREILAVTASSLLSGNVKSLVGLPDRDVDRISQIALWLIAKAVKEYQDMNHEGEPDYVTVAP